MRILLAGILGGIAMFAWSSIAHMALPLGKVGVKDIPAGSESAVLGTMQVGIGNASGLYLFPGMGNGSEGQAEAMKGYERKLATNPQGFLVYHPAGGSVNMPVLLGREFLTELFEALVVAWLLAQTRLGSYFSRVGFVFLAGLLAAVATNIPYWNWYGFPSSYTAAYMATQVCAFMVTGLVVAALVKPVPESVHP